jgi:hypothetical protein
MAITNFQPEIWSALILDNLRSALVYGQDGIINHDYEGDIAAAGDTVHITSFSDPAVRDYTKNTNITWDLLTDATRALVVDQADYFAFTVDDIDRRQALGGFVTASSRRTAYNLASEADTYLSGIMFTAVDGVAGHDLGDVTVDISDNNAYNQLVSLRTALTNANVPYPGRWVICPPEFYAALLQDNRFIDASASADGGQALRNGLVGRAAGFDVFESNTVPEPTANRWAIMAGSPIATTFAEQINETEAIRLENQFGDGVRGLHLYGGKVVQPNALAMITAVVQA